MGDVVDEELDLLSAASLSSVCRNSRQVQALEREARLPPVLIRGSEQYGRRVLDVDPGVAHQLERACIDGQVTPVRGDVPVEQHRSSHDVSLSSTEPMTAPTADQLRWVSVQLAAASTLCSVATGSVMTEVTASARASACPLGTTRPRRP